MWIEPPELLGNSVLPGAELSRSSVRGLCFVLSDIFAVCSRDAGGANESHEAGRVSVNAGKAFGGRSGAGNPSSVTERRLVSSRLRLWVPSVSTLKGS